MISGSIYLLLQGALTDNVTLSCVLRRNFPAYQRLKADLRRAEKSTERTVGGGLDVITLESAVVEYNARRNPLLYTPLRQIAPDGRVVSYRGKEG